MPTQSVNQNPANVNVSAPQAAPSPMNKSDDRLKQMQNAKNTAIKEIKQKKTEKKSRKTEFKDLRSDVLKLENTQLSKQASKIRSSENKEFKATKSVLKFKANAFKDGRKAYDIISKAIANKDMQPVITLLNPAKLAQLEKKVEKAHLSLVNEKEKLANMIEELRVKGEVLATKRSAYLQSKNDLKLLRREKRIANKQIKVIGREAEEKRAAEKEAKSFQRKYSDMLRIGK